MARIICLEVICLLWDTNPQVDEYILLRMCKAQISCVDLLDVSMACMCKHTIVEVMLLSPSL